MREKNKGNIYGGRINQKTKVRRRHMNIVQVSSSNF